jgi:hypothetical protein
LRCSDRISSASALASAARVRRGYSRTAAAGAANGSDGATQDSDDTRASRKYSWIMHRLSSSRSAGRFSGVSFLAGAAAVLAILPLACATSVNVPDDDDTQTTTSTSSSSTGQGGAGGGSTSSTGGSGPCMFAEDCVGQSDACNLGACINGTCEKLPTNESAPCDDGKTCSENDTCQAGACTGTPKFCPSTDSCHVGSCDLTLDMCVQVPGNDGAGCIDENPCTLTGVCNAGVCAPGQQVDCSFLDGECSVGVCDPVLGCVVTPLNDGDPCNDSLFCTINDQCSGGICGGSPNTCAPPGDICLIGTCNEASDSCVAVPGNNGAACNDNSTCTTGETCSNGDCNGGAPANQGGACDDASACTTIDICNNGVCAGTPVVACVNGDGCCPAGCDIAVDDDCGGVVYMTSSNGDPGFYGYDVETNSWAVLPDPPAVTYTQITTDGTHVLLLGFDNFIYSFDPETSFWSQGQQGPGFESQQPIGFLKWTPSGLYYVKDGNSVLRYSNAGGPWQNVNLPAAMSCAGSFDPVSGNLYIRHYGSLDLTIFSTASNTVTQTWVTGTGCGENSRTGSYYNGFFYAREWDQAFIKINVATGAVTNTGVTPFEGHTSTDVDTSTGDIYIGPYEPTGTTFQVYNANTSTLTTLQPAPVSVFDHSTVVLVK